MNHLRSHGCQIEREGGRHTILANPATGSKAPVLWHTEIDDRLTGKICLQLAVPPIR